MGWLTRSLRPPEPLDPNANDPASVPPATVGPPAYTPGDPHGAVVADAEPPLPPPPVMRPAPWSGWPAEWWTPSWAGYTQRLTDTAWTCIDLNASILASMPPFLVGAAPTLDDEWLTNPNPNLYGGWGEFFKSLVWDYLAVGEAFVLATARYSTGWPARFHVVPPWAVEVDLGDDGLRRYKIGSVDVSADIRHIRYQSSVSDTRGHGPLEAGGARLLASQTLSQYAFGIAGSGGIPPGVLYFDHEMPQEEADLLKAQWVAARQSGLGEPAVLQGGVRFETVSVNPAELALHELQTFNESRIAVLLRVPPILVGLPSGGDSMTYKNVTSLADIHWRSGLRPMATFICEALSSFLLPRGTTVELNKDSYVQPEPLVRAQTAQIYNSIQDPETGQAVLSVAEIREAEKVRQPGGGPIVGG